MKMSIGNLSRDYENKYSKYGGIVKKSFEDIKEIVLTAFEPSCTYSVELE